MSDRAGNGRGTDHSSLVTHQSTWRTVYALAWPVIVENALQTALGVVDTIMVARLGNEAVAGVGAATQFLFLSFGVFGGLAVGSTALVARFTGAGDPGAAGRVTKQSIWLAVLLGSAVMALGLSTADVAMALLGPAPAVARIGADYLRVTSLSMVFMVMMFVTSACLRGAGDTRTPMAVTALINVVNAAVAYVLIFGELGLPALGAVGSAWGAAAARSVGCLLLLAALLRRRNGLTIASRDDWQVDPGWIRRIVRIGLPAGFDQLLMGGSFVVYSALVITLGTVVFATMRITFNALAISFLPAFGFSVAAAALTGQALGAGSPDRARQATWVAVQSAATWMTAMAVVFFFTGEPLLRLFTDDPLVVEEGIVAMRYGAVSIPIFAAPMVIAGALRGAGDTRYPMLVNIVTGWLVRLPIAYLLSITLGLGLPGAYLAFAVDAALQTALLIARYRRGKWQEIAV
ncbi:MAG: MATE family efflux transporter [Chloroflexi bacterium]|nr:MATE family efflux transporter [Chloroflexota bacterium]